MPHAHRRRRRDSTVELSLVGGVNLTDPCCHGNQPPLFKQKSGYNSACMEDTISIPAPSRGFSGSSNLTVVVKFVSDQPRCHGNGNLEILTENWL